jgi:hypothetical protein
MIATTGRVPEHDLGRVIDSAATQGFHLVQCEMPHGELVWEWRGADAPQPQFARRSVALTYMQDWLRRNAAPRHRWSIGRYEHR